MRRSREGPSCAAARMRRGVAVVVSAFVLLAVASMLAEAARPSVLREAMGAAADGQRASPGVLETAEALAGRRAGEGGATPPEGFEDEVLSLAGRSEIRVDESGCVVGFSVPDRAEAAFAALAEELAGEGWLQVPSGWETCGSFAKDEGAYRWTFVACVEAGGATSVVVRYAMDEEGR